MSFLVLLSLCHVLDVFIFFFFFFKQKTAYEMRISDWSSDVCSSDLRASPCDAARSIQRCDRRFPVARVLRPARPPRRSAANPEPRSEIGRASCRERGCQYESISVVAVSLKKNTNNNSQSTYDLPVLRLLYHSKSIPSITQLLT